MGFVVSGTTTMLGSDMRIFQFWDRDQLNEVSLSPIASGLLCLHHSLIHAFGCSIIATLFELAVYLNCIILLICSCSLFALSSEEFYPLKCDQVILDIDIETRSKTKLNKSNFWGSNTTL
ncbi:hypothetical protein ACJIZ3_017365 [Penstemon smallii]|uniref:Uncharacterized protein n=1 Tax=Penstemon smallii TaxID=265156 RepID=A0ABD3SVR2_9LAMI